MNYNKVAMNIPRADMNTYKVTYTLKTLNRWQKLKIALMDFSLQYSLANDSGALKRRGITLTKLYKSQRGCVAMLLGFQSFKSPGRTVWQSNKEMLQRKQPITTSKHLQRYCMHTTVFPCNEWQGVTQAKNAEKWAKLSSVHKWKLCNSYNQWN